MSTNETIAGLAAFPGRGAGTDAERRAARWVAGELRRSAYRVQIETFWCRPNWALAQAWHVALGVAGSLVAVSSARVGGALVLVALLSVIADALLTRSPGRRLTREHASQNVIARAPDPPSGPAPVTLVLTGRLDAGRTGLVHRPPVRRLGAALRRLTGGLGPGYAGWLVLLLAWVEATAVIRLGGSRGTALGVAQVLPTALLVLALALLIDQGTAAFGPDAGDGAAGTAAAIGTARALAAGPPGNLNVELVLQGAGDGTGLGLRTHLRRHRRSRRPRNTIVLGFGPSGEGGPRWLVSDGQLLPLRSFAVLRRLAGSTAVDMPGLGAHPYRNRGCWPALPATICHIPAISLGALGDDGLAPRSHTAADTADSVDRRALGRIVQLALLLVDGIDGYLATGPGGTRR